MQHEVTTKCTNNGKPRGFARYAFSAKMIRFQDLARRFNCVMRTETLAECKDLLATIRTSMAICDDAVIAKMLDRNPGILRTVSFPGTHADQRGLFAYLPLNASGMEALLSGTMKGSAPDPMMVCEPGEAPCAIYIWLVFMPGKMSRAMGLLADLLDEAAPEPCPVFSKAVNLHAEQLNDSLGFMKASQLYFECAPELLVILPRKEIRVERQPHMRARIARDFGDMAKVLSVRSATYMAEQSCHFDEEFDGNDFCSTHWLGEVGNDAAGCIRARFFGGFAKIERLAVRADYRNSRLAYQLVREAVEHCRRKGYTKLYGHSRYDLVRFWRVFGFRPLEDRPAFSFADVQYVEMVCDLAPSNNAITLDCDPMMLIRPEGAWDAPGPFDSPPAFFGKDRKERIAGQTRTVGQQTITA